MQPLLLGGALGAQAVSGAVSRDRAATRPSARGLAGSLGSRWWGPYAASAAGSRKQGPGRGAPIRTGPVG
ncbi:hypothetical protein CHLRE_08g379163v5 [Chlamydomonas reinhardtii]|uniref:Uncharacterized protein n=1 Tax=Chlamydomonas reinhardtii TaxID=3055 RepID=A0A2K3DHX4_CHLRE|nr:uncharacterized protein CHLRE_08g379163v5 [Chlamydomonas reinhardtii]PNW80130.1 hypothetical protein CHLRE_08g379163v5 [Chlamydomonas reinhardtii]